MSVAHPTEASYRADIDGLRAVAVLAVVVNHLSGAWLPGGHLGVDVFFVISGFVITNSLQARRREPLGGFLMEFYARRFRRILPALLGCVSLAAPLAVMFAANPHATLQTGAASLVGISNVFLWTSQSGYFEPATDLNLLMHTWSLSVEEQFYLLYPLLLWRLGRGTAFSDRRVLAGLAVMIAASYLWFIHQWTRGEIDYAYYLLPPRAWQLGCGAAACLAAPHIRPRLEALPGRPALAWIGASVLAVALAGRFPPQGAALAVVGTVLLTLANEGDLPRRLLAAAPVVRVGVLSYSIYLYHWVVISAAHWTVGVDTQTAPWLLAATAGLAVASYRFIEQPLRHYRTSLGAGKVIGLSLAAIGFMQVGLWGLRHTATAFYLGRVCVPGGFETCVPPDFPHQPTSPHVPGTSITRGACFSELGSGAHIDESRLRTCSAAVSAERPTLFVLGDSFAGHLTPALEPLHERDRVNLVVLPGPACAFDVHSEARRPGCLEANRDRLQLLRRQLRRGDALLVAASHAQIASAGHLQTLEEVSREFAPRGVSVLLTYPGPGITGMPPPAVCGASSPAWFNRRALRSCDAQSTTPLEPYLMRMAAFNARLDELEQLPNFRVWPAYQVFCPNGACPSHIGGVRLYRDQAHPSLGGARMLFPSLRATLVQTGFLKEEPRRAPAAP